MPQLDWIMQRIPSLNELEPEQLEDVRNFSLLWAIYEARSLNQNGDPASIKRRVNDWNEGGVLEPGRFANALNYFRNRYFREGLFTPNFRELHANGRRADPILRRVMEQADASNVEKVQAVLLVVNRFRNNFLHGPKVEWGFANQVDNISHANQVLATAIETEEHFNGLR